MSALTPPFLWKPEVRSALDALANDVAELRKTPLPQSAVQDLLRWFRIAHVYNSNAIEGNRLTHGETRQVVEEGITIGGKTLREHTEARNLAEGVDFVVQMAARDGEPLTEQVIRELHSLVLRGEPSAGAYRPHNVRITGTDYLPPDALHLQEQMSAVGGWLATAEPTDPLLHATIAHTWLVNIHPFTDGNGRTARLLTTLVLLRAGYPFFVLRVEDRPRYFQALEASHSGAGDLTPLVELFLERTRTSLAEYLRLQHDVQQQTARTAQLGARIAAVAPPSPTGFPEWSAAARALGAALAESAEGLERSAPGSSFGVQVQSPTMGLWEEAHRIGGVRIAQLTAQTPRARTNWDVWSCEVRRPELLGVPDGTLAFRVKRIVEPTYTNIVDAPLTELFVFEEAVPSSLSFRVSYFPSLMDAVDGPKVREATTRELANDIWSALVNLDLAPA